MPNWRRPWQVPLDRRIIRPMSKRRRIIGTAPEAKPTDGVMDPRVKQHERMWTTDKDRYYLIFDLPDEFHLSAHIMPEGGGLLLIDEVPAWVMEEVIQHMKAAGVEQKKWPDGLPRWWKGHSSQASPPPSADEVEKASARHFLEQLGPERPGTRCRHEGCLRGTVAYSVMCAVHHYEMIHGRKCPV